MKSSITYDSPIGRLYIAEENGAITDLRFQPVPGAAEEETPLLVKAAAQLMAYFGGSLLQFDLPLAMKGTAFQQSCWQALRQIPYGETRSYAGLAAAIGNPKACRAVGMANNRNPISIIVPCHRVIGADGGLVGYGGGLDIKRALLALELKNR